MSLKEKVLPPLRVSKTEQEKIKEKAKAAGLSLSEYMRGCCLNGYVIQPTPIADTSLIVELIRQGRNFNNYQHKLNALGRTVPEEVTKIIDRIDSILVKLDVA